MTKVHKIFFVTILALGVITRFLWLDKFPPSLNWDEVSHGYTAFSLMLTGKDQWGASWPIFNTRSYGDYPTMANIYLTLPLIKLFGLNPITTRLPTALCGFLLIPLTFLLTKTITKKNGPSLLAALLTLLSPWTFFTSRAVFQSTVAQMLALTGLLLLFNKAKKTYFLPLSALLLGLSMYAYHNTRIFIPLFFITYLIIERKKLKLTKINILSLLIFLCLLVPQLVDMFNPTAQARSRWVFLINPASINYINTQRGLVSNPLIGKLVFNKVTYLAVNITKNYVNFLNPLPLFFNGTTNFQFNIPNTGLLLIVTLPFFYLGLWWLFRKPRDSKHQLLIAWFILGMLPAALTYGDFPSLRLMTILPLPMLFSSIGIFIIYNYINKSAFKKIFIASIIGILFIQSGLYFSNYLTSYFTNYSSSWQYGYQPMVDYLKTNYAQYDHIYITKKYGEPHEFLLYYWPWDPKAYQTDPKLNWNFHSDWYWVDGFDKFTFLNDWEIIAQTKNVGQKSLLVTSPGNYPQTATLLKTINFLNNTPAFDIVKL